jgi:putative ABC transport system permease protein
MYRRFILGNLVRDFSYAIRSLRKDKKFAFVAVCTLALGIGASTVVFSVFYNLLFTAFAAKDAGRLVVPVVEDLQEPGYAGHDHQLWIKWADLQYLREHNQLFENLVGSHSGIAGVQYGARIYQLENGHVSPDAFDFYGVAPLLGRGIIAEDGKPGTPLAGAPSDASGSAGRVAVRIKGVRQLRPNAFTGEVR